MFYLYPMKQKALLLLFFVTFSLSAQQPDKEGSLVKWLTIAEAMEKNKVQPKPIIMDFYTDWCGWCKHMMKTTYADPNLASYINAYFYPVKFDAEGKDTVEYLGQKYLPTSDKPRTSHPLAVKLLQGKLMYPTTLFLNGFDKEKNEFLLSMVASGYLEAAKIQPILIFTLENAFRNSNYDDFRISYEKSFFDSTTEKKLEQIKWKSAKETFVQNPDAGKKKLVFVNTEWCNTCKVMKRSSFIDSINVDYLKSKFDLIDFDPTLKDSLYYKGLAMTNPATNEMPYHTLAMTLCRGSLTMPTLVVMNEANEVIDNIPLYINAGFLNQIAHFYGDDIYKTKNWQEYTAGLKQ